ncbi:MAG: hypothetical protein GYA36_18845 [Veillonellaceae bacterium]|nr:hypothetical protein [Veillonellaceae bacterium]
MVSYIDLMVALLAAVMFSVFMVLIIAFYEWLITPQENVEPPQAKIPPETTNQSKDKNLIYQPVRDERQVMKHVTKNQISYLPLHTDVKRTEEKISASAMEKTDVENEIAKRSSHTIHGLARKPRAVDLPEVTHDGKDIKTD